MEHAKLERNGIAFALAILGVASLGGLFEIAPLFTIENTVEEVEALSRGLDRVNQVFGS